MPDDATLIGLFPGHSLDLDNRAFYAGWLEKELRLNRCADCRRWHHPPQPVCPACWSDQVRPTAVTGRGTIHLLIRLHQGPAAPGVDYAAGPYPVVVVELEEQAGLRFTSTIVGYEPSDLAIGTAVELEWIERAGTPFPVFRPVRRPSGQPA
ncbi:MAG: zinc ribbon domain-containing protein [Actinomycetota bacterium]|nr:zinc ribbon domain-containing protein [Actinomycetota bacterium]